MITQLKVFLKPKFYLIYNLKSIIMNKGEMNWKVITIKACK